MLFTLSCSCHTGGSRFGEIKPVSEICVESYDINRLPLEINEMSPDSGEVTVRYRFVSQNCLCDSNPIFVYEKPANWTVKMNGEEVLPSKRQHMFDETDGCYVIAGMVLDGENIIAVSTLGTRSFHSTAPAATETLPPPTRRSSSSSARSPSAGQNRMVYSSGRNIGSQAGSIIGFWSKYFMREAGTYFLSTTRRNMYSSNHSSVMMMLPL